MVEPLDRRVERPALGERADVELVEHAAGQLAPGPAVVRPEERVVVVEPRRRVHARGQPERARVGQRGLVVVEEEGVRRRRRRRRGRRRATSRPTPRACRVPGCRPGPGHASSAAPRQRTQPRANPARSGRRPAGPDVAPLSGSRCDGGDALRSAGAAPLTARVVGEQQLVTGAADESVEGHGCGRTASTGGRELTNPQIERMVAGVNRVRAR